MSYMESKRVIVHKLWTKILAREITKRQRRNKQQWICKTNPNMQTNHKRVSAPPQEKKCLNRFKPIKVIPQKIKENQVLSWESAELRNIDSGRTSVSASQLLQATKAKYLADENQKF